MADGGWRASPDGGFADGHTRAIFCPLPSAVRHLPSAISRPPSAISHLPSAISAAAIRHQRSRHQPTA